MGHVLSNFIFFPAIKEISWKVSMLISDLLLFLSI